MIESQKLALRYEVQLTDNTHLNDRQSPFPELWSLARHFLETHSPTWTRFPVASTCLTPYETALENRYCCVARTPFKSFIYNDIQETMDTK
jgi:hypothetical protein